MHNDHNKFGMAGTGQWPLITTPAALEYMAKAQEAVRQGLQQWQGINATLFTVPYTADGASIELPAIFVTPNSSQALPTLLVTCGLDYPKEVIAPEAQAAAGHSCLLASCLTRCEATVCTPQHAYSEQQRMPMCLC